MSTSFSILGVLLSLLGLITFMVTGYDSPTALIPTAFGFAMMWLAGRSRRSPRPLRWQIASVILAMAAVAGSIGGLKSLPALLMGVEVARPAAVAAQAVMALLCLIFLVPIVARLSTGRIPRRRQGTA